MTFYAADLARIHDDGFGEFARAAAGELLERQPRRGLSVELGCGSGISCQILAEAGFEVLGVDISADMLAIARQRVPRARFVEGSAWDVEIPPCVAVTAIGEVLNYAEDESAGSARLPDLFARIYDALERGGVFMFDFATPGRGTLAPSGPRTIEGMDWRMEFETVENEAARTLERRMTIEHAGQRLVETHLLRLYDRDEVRKQLEGPGFRSEALDRYSDFGFWPGYAAFAAVKHS